MAGDSELPTAPSEIPSRANLNKAAEQIKAEKAPTLDTRDQIGKLSASDTAETVEPNPQDMSGYPDFGSFQKHPDFLKSQGMLADELEGKSMSYANREMKSFSKRAEAEYNLRKAETDKNNTTSSSEPEDPLDRDTRINKTNSTSEDNEHTPSKEDSKETVRILKASERSNPDSLDKQYEYLQNDLELMDHAHLPGGEKSFKEYENQAYEQFVNENIDSILENPETRARIADQKVWDAVRRIVKQRDVQNQAKSSVSVEPSSGEDTKTEPEPPGTPPVDLSKLNDSDAITRASDEKDSGTSPAEDKDANGTTAFPEEDNKPVIDPNYKPRGPYFGKIDEYEGPGTFNNAIMTEKEKHDLAKVQAKEKAKAAGDTRSRWQKLKDRVSGKKLIAEVPQRPDETTAFPAEAVSTPFPEEAKSAPAEEKEPTTVAEYNAAMDSVKGDLKALWSSIPEDKKNDKLVVRINEDDGGDIDKYFAARTEVYKQDMKDSTELEQLKAVYKEAKFARDRVVEMVGKDKAEQIMNEAKIAASVAKEASEGEVSEPVVETPAEEAVSSPAESGAAPTEPVATSPEPSLNGASAPEVAPTASTPEQQKAEERRSIIETIRNNPNYGKSELTVITRGGGKEDVGTTLNPDPDGKSFLVDHGFDVIGTPIDAVDQIVDSNGNILFDRASMNGTGATSETIKPDEV